MPSRALGARQAVTSTTVSPDRTRTAPSACFASLPVSRVMLRDPIWISRRVVLTLCMVVKKSWRSKAKRTHLWLTQKLLSDAEAADELGVPLRILAFQVIEQPPALADELQ